MKAYTESVAVDSIAMLCRLIFIFLTNLIHNKVINTCCILCEGGFYSEGLLSLIRQLGNVTITKYIRTHYNLPILTYVENAQQ